MNKNLFRVTLLPLLVLICFSACEEQAVNQAFEDENKTKSDSVVNTTGLQVSKQQAIVAAEKFANDYNFKMENLVKGQRIPHKYRGEDKEVKNVLALKDGNEKDAIFLINYEKEGYVVFPADKRLQPVLAYSEHNYMPETKEEQRPEGLDIWFESQVNIIEHLRSSKQKSDSDALWEQLSEGEVSLNKLPPEDGSCDPWQERVDPLLTTTWGQGAGYNNDLAYNNCSTTANGRVLTGCVATAIAQIVNHHESAGVYSFNWSDMPDTYGNDAVSYLMSVAGARVKMDYGCNASGASVNEIESAFHDFGYSHADKVDYGGTNNYQDAMNDLDAGNPVLLNGFNDDSGHSWVADGYNHSKQCPSGNYYLNLHMNWGWNGNYDGWFYYNDFDPSDRHYNDNTSIIVNIEP